jgi:hypothetical protein
MYFCTKTTGQLLAKRLFYFLGHEHRGITLRLTGRCSEMGSKHNIW